MQQIGGSQQNRRIVQIGGFGVAVSVRLENLVLIEVVEIIKMVAFAHQPEVSAKLRRESSKQAVNF